MKKNGIIWAIESLIVLLLAVVIACFVSDSRRGHDRTPIQSMRLIEELGLYFGVREVRLNGYDGVGVWRTVFSSSQEKLLDPVSCSFMCNTDSTFIRPRVLKEYDRVLRFCRLDSTLVCIVSSKVKYRSNEIPVITYDDEGYFQWKGEKRWLMNCPFVGVYYSPLPKPGIIHWYPYDPEMDNWYSELLMTDAADTVSYVDLMREHGKNDYPSPGYHRSTLRQNGGFDYRDGKWIPREFSTTVIPVRDMNGQN